MQRRANLRVGPGLLANRNNPKVKSSRRSGAEQFLLYNAAVCQAPVAEKALGTSQTVEAAFDFTSRFVNERDGNVDIIRSPVRTITLPAIKMKM